MRRFKKSPLYTMAIIFVLVLSVVSCSKNDDPEPEPSPIYPQNEILGTWEVSETDDPDFKQCPNGDNKLFTISDTKITDGSTNLQGCDAGGGATYDYNYENGNTLNCGPLAKYEIASLTENSMTLIATYQNKEENPITYKLQRKP